MSYTDFIHLRNHSVYSLSRGALPLVADRKKEKKKKLLQRQTLIDLAVQNKMPAVGLTDSGNLFGSLIFSKEAPKFGIQPIIGCQLALPYLGDQNNGTFYPVVALARNQEGISNLRKLSTIGYQNGDPTTPYITLKCLCDHADGLFLLTGGIESLLNTYLYHGKDDQAAELLNSLRESFKDFLAVEINRFKDNQNTEVEPHLIALADTLSIPLVATNDCYFSNQSMYQAQDALMCIGQGTTIVDDKRYRISSDAWFKSATEMRHLFKDLPEACDNTLIIARKCRALVKTQSPLLPISKKVGVDITEEDVLRKMATDGLERRLQVMKNGEEKRQEYKARLEHELDIIVKMGFPGYFLIVADFIQWAKSHDIPVGPGRGSGAGSLVAYVLTITDIDPLAFGLLFERFLNPERVSMPDFDIDFCQDRRDEVIQYVSDAYGHDQVAQIITFGKLQAKAAIRDVGRVLGMPYGEVNRVAELVPAGSPSNPPSIGEALSEEPKLRELSERDENVANLLSIARQIEGFYRHASTHAAGVVIGDRKLVDLVALYRDPRSDMQVTQFNMKDVEQAGLVKFDFLGLTTLTVLKRGVDYLREIGINPDLSHIPLDDKKTFDLMAKGETAGVFQFEGAGMRDMLRHMQANCLEDLIAGVSLYRPGPMDNIPEYCRRKHGGSWEPPHEMIRPIVEETYGIMVYQEQVMQIAQVMAGYTLGQADLLRRAMGKKIASEMEKQRSIFTEGATKNGITPEKACEVFDLMAKFAEYGFNKSHAAAYAFVSYQTAWMKANYPVAFLAGCMSLAFEKTEKLAALCQEARRMRIKVLPVDINKSHADFSLERLENGDYAIRYALSALKRVGKTAMEGLVKERDNKPFKDLTDFSERISSSHINKLQLENLARAGAFDSMDVDRHTLFKNAEMIIRRIQARSNEKNIGQEGLFGQTIESQNRETIPLKYYTPWTMTERLTNEAESIGFYMSGHPLELYTKMLSKMDIKNSLSLKDFAKKGIKTIKVAGCIIEKKERITKRGSKMAWITLNDPSGSCEITVFSEVLNKENHILEVGRCIVASVDLKLDDDNLRITASNIEDIETVAAERGLNLDLLLDDISALDSLSEALKKVKKGAGRIILYPQIEDFKNFKIILPGQYRITPMLAEKLNIIKGLSSKTDYV